MILEPCPFCESEVEIKRYGDKRQSTQYQCTNCGCFLETGEEWDHGRRWNDQYALKRIKELEEQNMGIKECLGFFASVIKSGESWTPTCQSEYEKVIKK